MTYNPSVNDRSGEILANAMNNASLLNYQGMENLGQGIADGIGSAKQAALAVATGGTSLAASGAGQGSSSGSGDSGLISSFIQKSVENKMTSDYLDSMAGQFAKTPRADGVTPMMSAEDLEKFTKASLPKKQGMIVPLQAQFEQNLKNQYLAAQIAGFGQRQGYQNQVPPNQQPMAPLGTNASANNAAPQPQSIFRNPNIKTTDQFGR